MTPPVWVSDLVGLRSSFSWGKKKAIGNRVGTGIGLIDTATKGIRLNSGGIYVIQGIEGSRKTSILLNIVINQCLSGNLPEDYVIEWDSLESGMSVERISDMMVSMLANRFLTYWWATNTNETDYFKLARLVPEMNTVDLIGLPTITTASNEIKRLNVIKPEFLEEEEVYWSDHQKAAIEVAKNYVYRFPIIICGVSEDEDREERKKKTTITYDLGESQERWHHNAKHHNVRQIIVDHITKYVIDGSIDGYQAMQKGIPVMVKWQSEWEGGFHWVVAQVGATQRMAYRNSEENPTAFGGPLLAMEANALWHVKYDPKKTPYYASMELGKTRIGYHKPLAIPIEPESGAIIGKAKFMKSGGEFP